MRRVEASPPETAAWSGSAPPRSEPTPVGREQVDGGDVRHEFEGTPSEPWRPARDSLSTAPDAARQPDDEDDDRLFHRRHRPE